MSVAISPTHKKVFPETETTGEGLIVTVTLAVSEQLPDETITEYVAAEVGETVIAVEVAPVVHE